MNFAAALGTAFGMAFQFDLERFITRDLPGQRREYPTAVSGEHVAVRLEHRLVRTIKHIDAQSIGNEVHLDGLLTFILALEIFGKAFGILPADFTFDGAG